MSSKKTKSTLRPAAESLAADAPLGEATARLALAATGAEPPAHIKDSLLARIRGARMTALAGWRFGSAAEDGAWVRLPFPGVRMREITMDRGRDTALLYVEMEPGARFPDHQHAATERGWIISGDLEMAGRRLGAGDFYEADAGTRHERISSPSGCTGLLWVGATAWENWRAALATAGKR
jgi:hypothetical protein